MLMIKLLLVTGIFLQCVGSIFKYDAAMVNVLVPMFIRHMAAGAGTKPAYHHHRGG